MECYHTGLVFVAKLIDHIIITIFIAPAGKREGVLTDKMY